MGHRVIATISTFLTVKEAVDFVGNYNQNTRGCHSAELETAGPLVHMLEHDTETEAKVARAEQSGRQVCEWCGERPASLANALCYVCWDERERLKAEGEGAAE